MEILVSWFYAGKNTSEHWTWVGKFEYFKLNRVNEENMNKTVETEELMEC